jgi:WD repeat-containing protein 19
VIDISSYFEKKGQFTLAGKYMLLTGNYSKSLKLFLKSSSLDDASMELAISTIGQAKSDSLTNELISYLMGELDGVPKVKGYCKQ